MRPGCSHLRIFILFSFLIFPGLALAQQPVGIVTALKGEAQLTRAAIQTALRFKDDLILRDIIDTRERSLVRILFGGKSTVTVRELTRLEVHEELLPTGARRSIHELTSGAVLINVARELMGPGDEVLIRTPNAVAAVRGSTIFVEHSNPTTITVLAGSAIVTPNGGQPITLIAGQQITLTPLTTGVVVPGDIQTISDEDAEQIEQGEETRVSITDEAGQEETIELEVGQATQLATAVVEAITGETPTTSGESQELAAATTAEPDPSSFDPNTAIDKSQDVKNQPGNDNPAANSGPLIAGGGGGDIGPPPAPTNFSGTINLGENETLFGAAALATGQTLSLTDANVTLPGTSNILRFNSSCTPSLCLQIKTSDIEQNGTGTSLILVDSEANTVLGDFVEVTDSSMTTTGSIFEIKAGKDITVDGVTITANAGSSIDALRLLDIDGGSFTSKTTDFMVQFNGTTVTIEDLFKVSGSLTASGPLLKVAPPEGADSGGTWTFTGSSLLNVSGGGSVTSDGPFADLTNLVLDLGNSPVADISGASTLTNTAGPAFKIDGGSLSANALFRSDQSGNIFNLTGPVLDLKDTIVTFSIVVDETAFADLDDFNLSLAANQPILRLNNSDLLITGTANDEPVLGLSGENFSGATSPGVAVVATNNSSIINEGGGLLEMEGVFSTTATDSYVQLSNAIVDTAGNLIIVGDVDPDATEVTMAGSMISDSGSQFNVSRHFMRVVDDSTFTSTSTDSLNTFNGSTVDTGDDFARIEGGAIVTLSGTLLEAGSTLNIGTDPTVNGDLLDIRTRASAADPLGQLVINYADPSSPVPVVVLQGGTHTIGTEHDATNDTPNRIFNLQGVNTALEDGVGPFGTERPIKGNATSFDIFDPFIGMAGADVTASNPVGTLLRAKDGATIEVKKGDGDIIVGGEAARFDAALYESAGAIIHLTGSPTQTKLTTDGSGVRLTNSKVLSIDPVVLVDNSLFRVKGDAVIELTTSKLLVKDDLVSAISAGQIISDGDLLRLGSFVGITEASPGGTAINAESGGLVIVPALINFQSSIGGVELNNSITPNREINGVPVSEGSNVFIGPNAIINNLMNGFLVVNGKIVGLDTGFTGSVIKTSGLGTLVMIDPVELPTASPVLTIQNDVDLMGNNLANFSIGVAESVDMTGDRIVATALADQGFAQLGEDPTIKIMNATVLSTTDFIVVSGSTGVAVPRVLELTNATLDNSGGAGDLLLVNAGNILKSYGTEPAIRVGSTVKVSDDVVDVKGILALSGSLLNSANSSIESVNPDVNTVSTTVTVGTDPRGVAITPDGTQAYVANDLSNNVSVIDTATNTVIATVPVGVRPFALAITPDGSRVYVPNSGNTNNVSVIDTATKTVITSVAVGNTPLDLAIMPDGTRVYVPNSSSATVSVIDTATNTVIDTVPVGGSPQPIAITPDGTRAYVVNTSNASNSVSVIDTATNTVITTVGVGNTPRDVAITPDGSQAYVANVNGTVSVIDTATNTVTATVAVGGQPNSLAITPDSSRAYVTGSAPDRLSVIDTATNTVIDTVDVGAGAVDVAITPDGSRAYVVGRGPNSVLAIDTATNTVIDTAAVGVLPLKVAITPDANQAYVLNVGPDTVSVIDTNLAAGSLLAIGSNGSVISTSAAAAVQFNPSTVSVGSLVEVNIGASLSLAGPLVVDSGGTFTIGTDAFQVTGGSLSSTTTDPLIQFSGTTANVGRDLVRVSGVNTDAVTGLGTDKPLQTGGSFFEATNEASVEMGAKGFFIDTALLEASAPIIAFIGSASAQSKLTTALDTIDLFKSKVTSNGPVIALDNGLIKVNNGALINLTDGSNMTVASPLLSLINGSRINVVNGPLIRVDGVAPTGTNPAQSTLSVNGALAEFGGTGGNQIVVNNAIAVTRTESGFPVREAGGGAISIGPNPVVNPGLGSITVNGTGGAGTGVLIEATNNGQVNITAP